MDNYERSNKKYKGEKNLKSVKLRNVCFTMLFLLCFIFTKETVMAESTKFTFMPGESFKIVNTYDEGFYYYVDQGHKTARADTPGAAILDRISIGTYQDGDVGITMGIKVNGFWNNTYSVTSNGYMNPNSKRIDYFTVCPESTQGVTVSVNSKFKSAVQSHPDPVLTQFTLEPGDFFLVTNDLYYRIPIRVETNDKNYSYRLINFKSGEKSSWWGNWYTSKYIENTPQGSKGLYQVNPLMKETITLYAPYICEPYITKITNIDKNIDFDVLATTFESDLAAGNIQGATPDPCKSVHTYTSATGDNCVSCGYAYTPQYTQVSQNFYAARPNVPILRNPYSKSADEIKQMYDGEMIYITRSFYNSLGSLWYETDAGFYVYSEHLTIEKPKTISYVSVKSLTSNQNKENTASY